MKIELNVSERVQILNILPQKGNYITLKLVNELVSKVGFTNDELVDYKIKESNGIITWNQNGNNFKDIEFNGSELEIIRKELRQLDSECNLNFNTFTIYEKFCE